MINEVDPGKVRTIRKRVEDNSEHIDRIVKALVAKYDKELEDFILSVKGKLQEVKEGEELPNSEIERMTLRIPLFMYFAMSGLESLGVEGDTAKAVKMEAFNEVYIATKGTIQDKTKQAELNTFPEHLIELAFQRAYKELKNKLEVAGQLGQAAKKILTKRIAEIELSKGDGQIGGGYNDND